MAFDLSDSHRAMANRFKQADAHALGVLKMLDDVYPAFAKKLLENASFMKNIVLSGLSPIDILDYPVCGRCESLAAWDGSVLKDRVYTKACSCFKCGHKTIGPVVFRDWMIDELRHRAPPEIAETAEYVVDIVALQSIQMAETQIMKALTKQNAANGYIVYGD